MVPAVSTGIPRVPAYSGAAPLYSAFGYGALTLYDAPFHALLLCFLLLLNGPTTPTAPSNAAGLGSSPFDRLYLGNRVYFLFLRVLGCFGSPRSPPTLSDTGIASGGFPHSDIRGSMGICPSPRLFAACHVLRRLREPRHPPCALLSVSFRYGFPLCLFSPQTVGSCLFFALSPPQLPPLAVSGLEIYRLARFLGESIFLLSTLVCFASAEHGLHVRARFQSCHCPLFGGE